MGSDPAKPAQSFKFAWDKAREVVSRLAENGATDTDGVQRPTSGRSWYSHAGNKPSLRI
jgi:hypothetical protein